MSNHQNPSYEQHKLSLQQAIELAVEHHTAGELSKAESICQQILKSDPNHPVALHLLGVVANQSGKNDIAVDFLKKALALRPDYVEAHNNLGNVLVDIGKLDDAVTSYQKVLEFEPDLAGVHNNLGNAQQQLGRLDEALASFQKALSIEPDLAEAHNNLGLVLQEIGKLEEALESYYKALNIRPNYAEAHYNIGNTLNQLERLNEAVNSYQKALSFKPDYAKAYNNLGNTLGNLGKEEEAVASLQKAIAIDPDFVEANNNIGNVFKDLGQLQEAVASYHKALAIEPNFAKAHYNLGIAIVELGQLDEAINSYQKALAFKPDYAEVFFNIQLSLQALYHDILTKKIDISSIEPIIDSLSPITESEIIRLQLNYLTGGNTLEAWQKILHTMPTLQSETLPNPNKTNAPSSTISRKQSERKIVALLHFGRSGSGYLHSLLDDHPNVSTLPGVYMSGFFGREVWSQIRKNGFKGIPLQFSSLYKLLFDARNPEKIPPAFISDTYNNKFVGEREGFIKMGSNQDTPLTLDRGQFMENLSDVINGLEEINHGQLFEAIHHAYERTLGSDFSAKRLILYHLHAIDSFSMTNFTKYFPSACLLMIIRNPLQSLESWALKSSQRSRENKYKVYAEIVQKICSMLTSINHPSLHIHCSAAVRLEDIKEHPKETMRRLCKYLGIEETASLYNSTMQGLKWWGNPSSSLFGRTQTQYDEHTDPIRMKTGALFSTHDQFILDTLFYPLNARFGYIDENEAQFRKNLREIRPLIETPLDFEQKLADDFLPDYPELEMTEAFKILHAVLLGSWHKLDEYSTYPYMIKAMPEIILPGA